MGKVWVLDTATKGTGAEIRPLEEADAAALKGGQSAIVVRERKPRPPKPPEPAGPRRFRVVDVLTKRVLADDSPLDATVELLEDVRSIVDVTSPCGSRRPAAGRSSASVRS